MTGDDVASAVRELPDKQSASDPFPTRLLKDNIDCLAPFIVELFNRCLSTGSVPTSFKAAHITPLLKKPGNDPADPSSYRPIANLPVLSKLLGKPRRPAATRLPERGWAAPGTTVGLPSSSLDGGSGGQNPLRHSLGARHR